MSMAAARSRLSLGSTRTIVLGFLLAGLAIHAPLLFFHLLYAHDGDFHDMTARFFSQGLSFTSPFPRWLPEAQNGHGSPIFYFYSPAVYYVYALIDRLSFGLLPSHALTGLTMGLFTGGLGLSAYCLCRDYLERNWALVGALAFMAAPYHLDINFAIRGALPEAAALTWLPVIFLAVKRLAEARGAPALRRGFAMAALGFAGLIYTHVLSAVMTVPFVAVAALGLIWFAHADLRAAARRCAVTAAAFATGAALAAPLLVPAVALLGDISPVWWWENAYLTPDHFVPFAYPSWYSNFRTFMIPVSALALVLIGLGGEFALLPFFSRRRLSRENLLWAGLCVFALALALMIPPQLWARGSPFATAQFPYRYLNLLEFLCLLLALSVLRDLGPRRALWTRMLGLRAAAIGLGGALFCVAIIVHYNGRDLQETRKISLATNWQSSEYLPRAISGDFHYTSDVAERIRMSHTPFLRFESGTGAARVISQAGSRFLIEADAPQGGTLRIRQFAFPGWRAVDAATGAPLPLAAGGENGTLLLSVPAGKTRIRLYRRSLAPEWQGWLIALGALAVLAAVSGLGGVVRLARLPLRLRPES